MGLTPAAGLTFPLDLAERIGNVLLHFCTLAVQGLLSFRYPGSLLAFRSFPFYFPFCLDRYPGGLFGIAVLASERSPALGSHFVLRSLHQTFLVGGSVRPFRFLQADRQATAAGRQRVLASWQRFEGRQRALAASAFWR